MTFIDRILWKILRPKRPSQSKGYISWGARVHHSVTLGHWTEIKDGAVVNYLTELGDWSVVGNNAIIGARVKFGSWAKVGHDAIVEDDVVLGSHARIAPHAIVKRGTRVGDHDLVRADGSVSGRSGGSMMRELEDGSFDVYAAGKRFRIPPGIFFDHGESESSQIHEALDIWMWGETNPIAEQDLEQYIV